MGTKAKEIFKTILLVVLVLISIWLVFALWPETSDSFKISDLFRFKQEEETIYDISEIIVPSEVSYCDENGKYYLPEDRSTAFKELNKNINSFCSLSETMVEEISDDVYRKIKNSPGSLNFLFSFAVPFSEYCDMAGIKRGSGFESIEQFDEIIVSDSEPKNILLKDNQSSKYFLIISDAEISAKKIINTQELKNTDINFENIKDIMGEGDNRFIPFGDKDVARVAHIQNKVLDSADEEKLTRELFGETFDFARRAVDANGNISYMYGYGQKVLNIYKNGKIEYRAEGGSRSSNGILYDIGIAEEFLENIKILSDAEDVEYHLSSVVKESNGKGYTTRLEYIESIGGKKIYSPENKYAISVEVENGIVVYYQKNSMKLSYYEAQPANAAKELATVLAEKCEYIFNISTNEIPGNADQAYSFVCNNLKHAELGYYSMENSSVLYPCWKISMETGNDIYFDFYSGEVL